MRLSIKQTLTIGLAIVAAALLLAACDGSSGGDSSTGAPVSTGNVDGTSVLADSQGRTLYSADVEKSGKILCTGGCTSIWKPVTGSPRVAKTVAADTGMDVGDVKRPDGARQLTLDGKPLYTFTQEGPGKLDGNGVADDFSGTHFQWSAAGTSGAAASNNNNSSNYSY
jgi:predicted lipoprotein with Yx(FWY)xxD motif